MYTKVAKRMPQESLLAFQHIVKNIMHPCFVTYKKFLLMFGKGSSIYTNGMGNIWTNAPIAPCHFTNVFQCRPMHVTLWHPPISPFVPHEPPSLPFHSSFPSFPMSPNVLVSSPIIPFHSPPPPIIFPLFYLNII